MASKKTLVLVSGSLALAVLMFAPISISVDRRFWDRLLDAGHLPLFFAYAVLLWWAVPWNSTFDGRRTIAAVMSTVAIAGLVELVQPFFGRTKSAEDFRNGAIGALIAGGAISLARSRKGPAWWIGLGGVTVAASMIILQPAWAEARGILWRHSHFPVLGEFEELSELCLWEAQGGSDHFTTTIELSSEHAGAGVKCLKVKTGAGSWAGVSYSAGDKDWRAGRALSMEVFNPGQSFRLSLRVDDDGDCSKYGQRYDDGFAITNGWNHLSVPIAAMENGPRGRKLNLGRIRRLAIFTGESEPGREFFLDHIRLE